jgi:large subunit ribosomal protein L2
MGKTIIQQARGHGSFTYRVRRSAYRYRIGYPHLNFNGKLRVVSLLNSAGHSAPLAKLVVNGNDYFIPASQGIYEGQEIEVGSDVKEDSGNLINGNIAFLKNLPVETRVFNIEIRPGDGGKIARSSGMFGVVLKKFPGSVTLLIGNKREINLNENCRATIGIAAGQGRKLKPVLKAGKKWHMMKARNKLWPRTSAVKFNAVDHPFGCGRGKRIKSKIAKKNAPPGAKVGHLLPRRTGHVK